MADLKDYIEIKADNRLIDFDSRLGSVADMKFRQIGSNFEYNVYRPSKAYPWSPGDYVTKLKEHNLGYNDASGSVLSNIFTRYEGDDEKIVEYENDTPIVIDRKANVLRSVVNFDKYLTDVEVKNKLDTSHLLGSSSGRKKSVIDYFYSGREIDYSFNPSYLSSSGNRYELSYVEGTEEKKIFTSTPENIEGKEYEGFDFGGAYHIPSDSESLIEKTSNLYALGKINSFISRYYNQDEDGNYLSRGRNLLKANRTHQGDGYDNPYCRVWTTRNRYSEMKDRIRPFLDDKKENFYGLDEYHTSLGSGYRPMDAPSRIGKMSVLKPNGFVNMGPYRDEKGYNTESIKKCMFSIENLAWKDVLFDTAVRHKMGATGQAEDKTWGPTLTKEQQGPNGGRIMWFPPYNLKFTENVNTRWNDNDFIGRGEKIYTYVNTERGGTLSFTLLIDHPSVLDVWHRDSGYPNGKSGKTSKEREDEVLRYFAGCAPLKPNITPEGNFNVVEEEVPSSEPKKNDTIEEIKFFVFYPNNYSGVDYTKDGKPDKAIKYLITGNGEANRGYEVSSNGQTLNTPIQGKYGTWKYKVDDETKDEKLKGPDTNYSDTTGFSYNAITSTVSTSVDDIVRAFSLGTKFKIGKNLFSLKDVYNTANNTGTIPSVLKAILIDGSMVVDEIKVAGHASSHGTGSKNVKNPTLVKNRATTVAEWLRNAFTTLKNTKISVVDGSVIQLEKGMLDVSDSTAKLARSAEVTIKVHKEGSDNAYAESRNEKTRSDDNSKPAKLEQDNKVEEKTEENTEQPKEMVTKTVGVYTANTYDDEFLYFRDLKEADKLTYDKIIDKIHFFTPAFHSITPEGFNARLTFLHQCTRQGPTASLSDGVAGEMGAGNLAFGRPPYCILRIGDFYNVKILIESVSINYDTGGGVQWDLNPEGAGVQPMMANVDLTFKFIGGTDISGPIDRLQNAVSFNYYSNASLYDRRADYRANFINDEQGNKTPLNTWDASINLQNNE